MPCVCVCACAQSIRLCPHGSWSTRLLCPWNFPRKNTGVGCHAFLQGIFLTQGSNQRLFLSPVLAGSFFIKDIFSKLKQKQASKQKQKPQTKKLDIEKL